MIELLIGYFIIGALLGTFVWFVAGRHAPVHPHIPKQVTLLVIMIFWPVALLIMIWWVIWGEDA